jgi:hypothetical protein
LGSFGIGAPASSIEAAHFALPAKQQVLLLPHQRCQRPGALGKSHRHLGQRVRRAGLQRPLRKLEAFLTRAGIVATRAINGASMGAKRPAHGAEIEKGG